MAVRSPRTASPRRRSVADLSGQILVPYPAESALSGVQKHSDYMFYRRTVDVPRSYRTRQAPAPQLRRRELRRDGLGERHPGGPAHRRLRRVQRRHHRRAAQAGPAGDRGRVALAGRSASHPGRQAATGPRRDLLHRVIGHLAVGLAGAGRAPTSIASFTATPNVDLVVRHLGDDQRPAENAEVSVDAERATEGRELDRRGDRPLELADSEAAALGPGRPVPLHVQVEAEARHRADIESYAGLRSIAIAKVDGKQRIVLNGKPTFLLGTLDQGYWPDGIYTAPTDDALKFDIQKTKDLGFNTIRKHIKVEPARWYYWADKLGLMVWQDQPALPTGRNDRLTASDKANFRERDLARWSTSSRASRRSSAGSPSTRAGASGACRPRPMSARRSRRRTRRGSSTRAAARTAATPRETRAPATSSTGTSTRGRRCPLRTPRGPRSTASTAGSRCRCPGHLGRRVDQPLRGRRPTRPRSTQATSPTTTVLRDQGAPYGLSGGVYTQITDVEGEQNGLFTYDRQVEKVDEARVRAINLSVIDAGSETARLRRRERRARRGRSLDVRRGPGHDRGRHRGQASADAARRRDLAMDRRARRLGPPPDGRRSTPTGTVVPTRGRNYSVSAWVRLDNADGAFQTVVSEDGDNNSAFFLQYSGADQRWAFSFVGAGRWPPTSASRRPASGTTWSECATSRPDR